MPKGRIRENPDLTQAKLGEPGTASLRGNQITEYRPDLNEIKDPATAHALRWTQDAIYQLAGAMFPAEPEPEPPELTVPEANPLITPGVPPTPTEGCTLPELTAPPAPTVMTFLFGGENAYTPGDGFLYTGNSVQARIEIVEYFSLPNATPQEIGQYDFPGSFQSCQVAVWGDTMYVGTEPGGVGQISILDVTDRTNPVLLAPFGTNSPAYMLAFSQSNTPCICKPILAGIFDTPANELRLMSLEDPHVPVLLGAIGLPATTPNRGGLNAGRRGVLYGSSGGKLWAWNISNPTNPQLFSSNSVPYIHFRSFYQSYGAGFMYICDYSNKLIHVWNVQDPRNMSEVSTATTHGFPVSSCVDNAFLYVTSNTSASGGQGELELFEITTPTVPLSRTVIALPTSSSYSYGLLTRDGAFAAHAPITGNEAIAWLSIEYPVCCNCNPVLRLPGTF